MTQIIPRDSETWQMLPPSRTLVAKPSENQAKRGALFETTKGLIYNFFKSPPKEVYFSCQVPIFLLGKSYILTPQPELSHVPHTSAELRGFMQDFSQQIWITYRSRFVPLVNSSVTSDLGWGCTIRSGQMMLARALLTVFQGREITKQNEEMRNMVLRWFVDQPGAPHPYSIHNVMQEAKSFGINPGDWLSTSHITRILKILVQKNHGPSMAVYVAEQMTISKRQVMQMCETDNGNFTPALIVIPVRLGLARVEESYISQIRLLLSMKQSVGILGGRPNSCYYLAGSQESSLIYLDPHYVHRADFTTVDVLQTYRCETPLLVPIRELDPSMTFGFLCTSKYEFEHLCTKILQHL